MNRGLAVVTGASSGIGAATAHRLAKEGFDLVVGARRLDRLQERRRRDRRPGPATSTSPIPTSVDAFCAEVPECRVLVNNAGGAARARPDRDRRPTPTGSGCSRRTSLGTVRMTQALLPALEASGDGHVVMIGSVAGIEPYPGGAGYNAAKFGVRAFTQVLRMELLGRPIRVTEVDPGHGRDRVLRRALPGRHRARAAQVYEGVDAADGRRRGRHVGFAVDPAVAREPRPDRRHDAGPGHWPASIHRRPPPGDHCMTSPSSRPVFTGVAVALVTFFDEHGHVDLAATATHAAHLAEPGRAGDRGGRHHGRGVAPLDEGATAAARRRPRRGAATTCPSSSARGTCPPA